MLFDFPSVGCGLALIDRHPNNVRVSDPELQFDNRNDTVFRF